MGAPSFGSFGPAGPGFGSIQNAPATGVNPTAFPTAPPPAVGGGGVAPGGLGNMVGMNLQPQQLQNMAPPQAFRAPLPLPPPPASAAAGPAAPPGPVDTSLHLGPMFSGGPLVNQNPNYQSQANISNADGSQWMRAPQAPLSPAEQQQLTQQRASLFGLGGQ